MKVYVALLDKAIANREGLSTNEVMALLTPPSLVAARMLRQTAHLLRLDATGKCVHLRAIIEFSNYCRQECLYCVKGAQALNLLRPGDKVLIAEACTHHPIEDDIGTVKTPSCSMPE
jgi:biotin synthase-like enzyme